MNCPLSLSSEISRLVFKLIPLPRKFFSVIPPPTVPPEVPKPAPSEISPVGCSSTQINYFKGIVRTIHNFRGYIFKITS